MSPTMTAPREVIATSELSNRAKVLYLAVSACCDDGGGATLATAEQLGAATGMNVSAVRRGMAELVEHGLVIRDRDRAQSNSPFRTRLANPKKGKK